MKIKARYYFTIFKIKVRKRQRIIRAHIAASLVKLAFWISKDLERSYVEVTVRRNLEAVWGPFG